MGKSSLAPEISKTSPRQTRVPGRYRVTPMVNSATGPAACPKSCASCRARRASGDRSGKSGAQDPRPMHFGRYESAHPSRVSNTPVPSVSRDARASPAETTTKRSAMPPRSAGRVRPLPGVRDQRIPMYPQFDQAAAREANADSRTLSPVAKRIAAAKIARREPGHQVGQEHRQVEDLGKWRAGRKAKSMHGRAKNNTTKVLRAGTRVLRQQVISGGETAAQDQGKERARDVQDRKHASVYRLRSAGQQGKRKKSGRGDSRGPDSASHAFPPRIPAAAFLALALLPR